MAPFSSDKSKQIDFSCTGFSTGSALTHWRVGSTGWTWVWIQVGRVGLPTQPLSCLTGPSCLSPGTSVPSWEALPERSADSQDAWPPICPPVMVCVSAAPAGPSGCWASGVRNPDRHTHLSHLSVIRALTRGQGHPSHVQVPDAA